MMNNLKENDIIIATVTNGYLQHKIIPKKWEGYNYNGAIIRLTNIKCNINYLYYALQSIEKIIIAKSSGGAQKNLGKAKKLVIPTGAFHEKKDKNKKEQLGGKRSQEKLRRLKVKYISKRKF